MYSQHSDARRSSRSPNATLKIGCAFNVTPMWHPLRLAEDYATADLLTGGRIVFGVGRGYHTREVEVLVRLCLMETPTVKCSRNRLISSSSRLMNHPSPITASTTISRPRCRIGGMNWRKSRWCPVRLTCL